MGHMLCESKDCVTFHLPLFHGASRNTYRQWSLNNYWGEKGGGKEGHVRTYFGSNPCYH